MGHQTRKSHRMHADAPDPRRPRTLDDDRRRGVRRELVTPGIGAGPRAIPSAVRDDGAGPTGALPASPRDAAR